MKQLVTAFILTTLLIVVATPSVFAHGEVGIAGGFMSGFMHPLLGWDHVAAMVAVGLWGAFLGAPAIWLLPVVFPLIMACGGAIGVIGIPMPGVEIGIALSAVVLGSMIALAARTPVWVATVIAGAFAVFHGHAHGTELPHAVNALTYSAGFVTATGLLHLTGISLGLIVRWPTGKIVVQVVGGLIACAGLAFLIGVN